MRSIVQVGSCSNSRNRYCCSDDDGNYFWCFWGRFLRVLWQVGFVNWGEEEGRRGLFFGSRGRRLSPRGRYFWLDYGLNGWEHINRRECILPWVLFWLSWPIEIFKIRTELPGKASTKTHRHKRWFSHRPHSHSHSHPPCPNQILDNRRNPLLRRLPDPSRNMETFFCLNLIDIICINYFKLLGIKLLFETIIFDFDFISLDYDVMGHSRVQIIENR